MRFFRGRLVLLLFALLITARLASIAAREIFDGPGPLGSSRALVIPSGGTAQVAAALARDGAIAHPIMFRLAAHFTRGRGPIRAGEFFVPAHASLAEILDILRRGAPVEHQVTIPEGLTGAEIARILNAAPAASGYVAPPPQAAVLPQSYDYTYGTPRARILARAEAAMARALGPAWAARAQGQDFSSPAQALILASIVQQESPVAAELPQIAAVYENRLARGLKLQADPTVIFAASAGARSGGAVITRAELANPSPYNTYVHAGLPPGPICAPGLAAINAVLHPASSKALYFVATGTGGHVFADDFSQQLKNIAAYRKAMKAAK